MNPIFDFSYEAVFRSVEESLERLEQERVDILYIHDPDDHYDQAMGGAYRALLELRDSGRIGAIGVGMNQVELLTRLARQADFDCFLLAGRYTLLDQTALSDLLPLCAERGIAIVAGGIYNSGILANPRHGAFYNYEPASTELIERALRLKVVCSRFDVPLKAAAVQFPLHHAAVASILLGCRSAAEVDDNIEMLKIAIPPELWRTLKAEGLVRSDAPTP